VSVNFFISESAIYPSPLSSNQAHMVGNFAVFCNSV